MPASSEALVEGEDGSGDESVGVVVGMEFTLRVAVIRMVPQAVAVEVQVEALLGGAVDVEAVADGGSFGQAWQRYLWTIDRRQRSARHF